MSFQKYFIDQVYLLFTDIRIVTMITARAQIMAVTSNNIWFLFILAYRDE